MSFRARTRRLRSLVLITAAVVVVVTMSGTAQAATVLVQLSSDPYTNTSSYHQTELEPDSYSFGNTIVAAFQTGRFTDGGASNTGWATSSNAGASWSHGFMPGTTVFATPAGTWARVSDPAVAYDARHNVWLVTSLAIDSQTIGKAVLVNRSTDGGFTWGNPVTVSLGGATAFYDKEWIACDNHPASPAYGNCYVEWDNANNGNALRMARSTDGGLTWTNSTAPSDSVIGGQPVTQPNGKVVVPIANGFGSQLRSYVSTDGGATYTGPFTISSIQTHTQAANLRSGAGLASAEVDAAGKIYVVWHDCRFRAGCAANDLVMSTSTDGQSWSAVTRIPVVMPTSSADVFIPGIAVDPTTSGSTARLGVGFYAYTKTNCTVSTCRLLGGFISSTDGGAHWSTPKLVLGPLRLGWLPLTTQGYMVGDYISTSIAGGLAFPIMANATSGQCNLGQITTCHEYAATAASGLPLASGTRPATSSPVRTTESDATRGGMRTAF
ncbi:MAG TPA: sialidase family protein [Actinomycetota bacterium]|nr:sialidase family protein [Actinomycetota bacterium]